MSPAYRETALALLERQRLITRLVDAGHLGLATVCRAHLHTAMTAWLSFEQRARGVLA